jgi:hypothetical protein
MIGCASILTDITDEQGDPIGRSVPVDICYRITVDSAYGADADGNRGEMREEVEILGRHIDQAYLLTMTGAQVEQALADADAKVLRMRERLHLTFYVERKP